MPVKLSWLRGVFPALVTPFGKDEKVDEKALRSLVNRLIDDVDGFVPCGTTGEFPYLSVEEQKRIIEIVVGETKGRKPVIAGTCAEGTHQVINLVENAKEAGADACLVVTPYFLHPSEKGVYQHFYKIAEATDIPIIMYNIPQTVGAYLPRSAVEDLSDIPNIVGLKDSSGNLAYTMEVMEMVQGRIDVMIGHDEIVLPALAGGCSGMILASAQVFPEIWQKIYAAIQENNLEIARSYQMEVQRLARIFCRHGGGLAVKAALNMMGIKVGTARRPLKIGGALLHETRAEIQSELEKLQRIKSPAVEFGIPKGELEDRFSDVGLSREVIRRESLRLGSGVFGNGFEKVQLDLIAGLKDSFLGFAYAFQLTHPRHGHEALTAILEPNLAVRPPTLIVPTVELRNLRQANMIYGPAQAAVAKVIADSLASGVIPTEAMNEELILVKTTVHPKALDRHALYTNVYQAMEEAVKQAFSPQETE